MRHVLLLMAITLYSINVSFSQISTSISYVFSKGQRQGETVKQLIAPEHSFIVERRTKDAQGYFVRNIWFDEKPYHWRYKKAREMWTLYKGDSVVAEAMTSLRIAGVEYEVKQVTKKSVVYKLNGKEVMRVLWVKEKGKNLIKVEVLQDQDQRQQTLIVAGTYFGLSLIEAKRAGTAGFFIGFPIGFLIGAALAG